MSAPAALDTAALDAALRPRTALSERERHRLAAARLCEAERAARGA